MPGFNPEKLNIHELTIEEPEKESVAFDPEKEITDELWQGMINYSKNTEEKAQATHNHRSRIAHTITYISDLARLKILSEATGRKLPETYVQNANTYLKNIESYESGSMGNILKIGYSMSLDAAILGLEKLSQRVSEDLCSQAAMARGSYPDLMNPEHVAQIFGQGRVGGLDLGEDFSEEEKKELYRHLNELKQKRDDGKLIPYAAFLRMAGLKVGLSQKNWQDAMNALQSLKEQDHKLSNKHVPSYVTSHLFYLSVLAADEVIVPKEGGLKLVFDKKQPFEKEAPSIPEQRNF